MILCPTCRRHLFANEARCPFCGAALTAEPRRPAPAAPSPDLSRAQRYALGTAIAVTVAGAGCSPGPTIVPAPARTVQTQPDSTDSTPTVEIAAPDPIETDNGPGDARDYATPPDPDAHAADTRTHDMNDAGAGDPDKRVLPDDLQQDMHWRRRRSKCVQSPKGMICPPYGCVFPDEACDIVRA